MQTLDTGRAAAAGEAWEEAWTTLTEADLDNINAGQTVVITTSNDDNHTHTFSFHT